MKFHLEKNSQMYVQLTALLGFPSLEMPPEVLHHSQNLSVPPAADYQMELHWSCASSSCVVLTPFRKLQHSHIGHTSSQQVLHHQRGSQLKRLASFWQILPCALHFCGVLRGFASSWSPDCAFPCSWCPERRRSQGQ